MKPKRPKYGGRQKGTPNKDTKQLREKVNDLLENSWDQVLEDLDSLTPKERVDTYTKLLEYALPKLNRTEVQNVTTLEHFMEMTPEQRRARIIELNQKLNNANGESTE